MKKIIILISILLVFSSCKTTNIMPEKQKGFDEKNTEYAQMPVLKSSVTRKKKTQKLNFKLYGTVEDNVFSVSEIYWFNNWKNGWTEASFAANGKLKIKTTRKTHYEVITPLEIDFPTAAKLRIKDSILINDKALQVITNRLDRIYAAIELLKDSESPLFMNNEFIDYSYFEKTVGSLLFPEKYEYSTGFKKYSNSTRKKDGNFSFADGIYWNVDYSKEAFPEYVWDVRNSGTLYKDWEENLDLFYYLYNWNFYFGNDLKSGKFKKVTWSK